MPEPPSDSVRAALAHLGGEVARTVAYLRQREALALELLGTHAPVAAGALDEKRRERIGALLKARDAAAKALAETRHG